MRSYRLLRMEPRKPDFPGAASYPEVIGQLDVDSEAGWPPVVALFIDVGNTPPELIERLVDRTRASLQGLFPAGRTLFVPQRGQASGTTIYRLEPEAPDPEVNQLRIALTDIRSRLLDRHVGQSGMSLLAQANILALIEEALGTDTPYVSSETTQLRAQVATLESEAAAKAHEVDRLTREALRRTNDVQNARDAARDSEQRAVQLRREKTELEAKVKQLQKRVETLEEELSDCEERLDLARDGEWSGSGC